MSGSEPVDTAAMRESWEHTEDIVTLCDEIDRLRARNAELEQRYEQLARHHANEERAGCTYRLDAADNITGICQLATDAQQQVEAQQQRIEELTAIIANPAANWTHSPRCIEKGWQQQEGGCYCQDDPRDPEEVLEQARALLAQQRTNAQQAAPQGDPQAEGPSDGAIAANDALWSTATGALAKGPVARTHRSTE